MNSAIYALDTKDIALADNTAIKIWVGKQLTPLLKTKMQNINTAVIDFSDNQMNTTLFNYGLHFKKIFINNINFAKEALLKYPGAEIVDNYSSILEDRSIKLIVISKNSHSGMQMAGEAIRVGKRVRII